MWMQILDEFKRYPRDVRTIPLTRRAGKWFHVSVEGNHLCIQRSKKDPACHISRRICLREDKWMEMLDFYYRRCRGEKLQKDSRSRNRNRVYWDGVFAEINL